VVGLAWSHDPESYASGSVATGRVFHAGEFEKLITIAVGRKHLNGDENHGIGTSGE
jgi:hypothetical protein